MNEILTVGMGGPFKKLAWKIKGKSAWICTKSTRVDHVKKRGTLPGPFFHSNIGRF